MLKSMSHMSMEINLGTELVSVQHLPLLKLSVHSILFDSFIDVTVSSFSTVYSSSQDLKVDRM